MRPLVALGLIALAAGGNAARAYSPAVNFQINCMGCHLADGSGEPGRVPSIRRTLVPFSGIPAGRAYVVRVPGVAQAPLSDDEIAALLNWMARSLSDVPLPPGFRDYSAVEIKGLRSHALTGVSAERARLLQVTAPSAR